MRTRGLVLWMVVAFLAGCDDNELGIEKRRPNRPPETVLASGPPDSTTGTTYKVHLFWSGSDPDGTVDHYDYILVDHPAADDSIVTSNPDAANRVVVSVPAVDDPRWISTFARDSIIVTRADTLRRNPQPRPGETNEFVRMQSFERWHTFFVRSVDNEGREDPTPDFRSFNAKTLAPEVFLKPPISANAPEFAGPRVIVFNWDGIDPVGDNTTQAPIASRWVLLTSRRDQLGNYAGFPDSLYRLRPSRWSPWRRWEASDKSGVRAVVRNLRPATGSGEGFYLFAVQAMDDAGAVTPVFDATTGGKNNVARIRVSDRVGATLTVSEKFLGTYNFSGPAPPVILDVAAAQPVKFTWRADASDYGGEIVAYRYGWNIRNPSNDEEWEQNWCGSCLSTAVRTFTSGTQRFFLETRDNAETVTHAEFELVVRQVTRRRDLLLVDDTVQPQESNELTEDVRWQAVMDSLLRRQPFDFVPSRDIYDVVDNRNLPPDLSLVFDYKTVVWNVVSSTSGSALRTLAMFFDPFVERNRNLAVRFNYLSIYVDNGGELWVTGNQPAHTIWPVTDNRPNPNDQLPANITNWDDIVTPHPQEDSVGVNSLLWKLGVEALDLGGGGRAPRPRRDNLPHNCQGFRKGTPPGFQSQSYASDTVLDHSHRFSVQSTDVENLPAGGVTYQTTLEADHRHSVSFTREQLRTMQRGGTIVVTSTESATPEPHAHEYTVRDRVGLWGGPGLLETDASWPQPPVELQPPGLRGRPNIEIYNMPSYMGSRQPPLSPEPGISVALYNYISGVPENPTNGILYPLTADQQPALILRRAQSRDTYYSRAICGFEPFLLKFQSHLDLTDFILIRHFRLGQIDPP